MTTTHRLTVTQAAVLRFVGKWIAEHGYSPSLRDIMQAFRWVSTNAAGDHLKRLEAKGLLVRTPKISRGLALTDRARMFLDQPPPPEPSPDATYRPRYLPLEIEFA